LIELTKWFNVETMNEWINSLNDRTHKLINWITMLQTKERKLILLIIIKDIYWMKRNNTFLIASNAFFTFWAPSTISSATKIINTYINQSIINQLINQSIINQLINHSFIQSLNQNHLFHLLLELMIFLSFFDLPIFELLAQPYNKNEWMNERMNEETMNKWLLNERRNEWRNEDERMQQKDKNCGQ